MGLDSVTDEVLLGEFRALVRGLRGTIHDPQSFAMGVATSIEEEEDDDDDDYEYWVNGREGEVPTTQILKQGCMDEEDSVLPRRRLSLGF